jgi:hypothetical protein
MSRTELIKLLQNAHAGERAAAYAYQGHAKSVSNAFERAKILEIEREEWDHRAQLAQMLNELGSKPRFRREILMAIVGRTISCLCRIGGWLNVFNFGWFFGMYGAGKLEQGNIVEYEIAARYAVIADCPQFVECLLHMAEVEWDHELYFRTESLKSSWVRYFKIWPSPPPREQIRSEFFLLHPERTREPVT